MSGPFDADVEIRTYRVTDRAAVVALWEEVFAPYTVGHNSPGPAADRKAALNDDLFFVAESRGEIVGTTMAGYDGPRGWLYSVAVSPRLRGRGLGSALVRHAEAALAARGCPKVNLQVRDEAPELTAFYESLGYRVDPVISMGRRLDEPEPGTPPQPC
ncbi:MAG: GNAT family acetyltransferase [Planctomycetota bacterium]